MFRCVDLIVARSLSEKDVARKDNALKFCVFAGQWEIIGRRRQYTGWDECDPVGRLLRFTNVTNMERLIAHL